MARIVLTTHGSSGDLNPFIALGLGLRARGHQVAFAVTPQFAVTVRAAGFVAHELTDDPSALVPYAQQLYGTSSSVGSLKIALQKGVLPTLQAKVVDLRAACADADLLVSAALQLPASFVADLTGIPWASIALSPITIPSRFFAPISAAEWAPAAIQPLINRASWAVGARFLRPIADPAVNTLRATFGLAPRRDLLQLGNVSQQLTAVATSPAFIPPAPDWPSYVRMTGFCFWDAPTAWHEPAELTAFLAGTQPVVAVSSGSMAPDLPDLFAAFFQTSIAAIRRAGARALVIGATPEQVAAGRAADLLAVPFAPFSHIYPRCAAVIHHGGIGTIAQALRAGVPMLVAPWGFDQFFAAAHVARRGVGAWVPRRAYRAERVASVLAALIHQPQYRIAAAQRAQQIAQEDGVATLCAALEDILTGTPTHPSHDVSTRRT